MAAARVCFVNTREGLAVSLAKDLVEPRELNTLKYKGLHSHIP